MHSIALGDGAQAFAGLDALKGFLLLVVVELGCAAELGAALDRGDAAFVGALEDAVALFLGEA